jgi:succinoglycan biosynthesis transport protein ExoP
MTYASTPAYRPPHTDGLNPLQILRRLCSRRWLLLFVTNIVFASLAYAVFQIQPLYTATAEILIEAPPAEPTNPLQTSPSQLADREKVASEVQVLMSRGLADSAVRAFHLSERAEFNPTLDLSLLGRFRVLIGATGTQAEIAANFTGRLNVFPVGTSRVIAVAFTSNDPELARDVANRVADLYIDGQRQSRVDLNAQASGWLQKQIESLRERVADSEAKAEMFRAGTGLLEGNGVQLQSQQLSELNTQLGAVRAARAEAEARVAALERLAGQNGGEVSGNESEAQVLQSPLIQQLRGQEVQLKREISEMSAELLPTHPRMIQKQAELDNLEGQIHSEIEKVIASVRSEARVAATRENTVQRQLRTLESRRAVADRDQIELRALERESAADRSVLEAFLARYTEISTRGDASIQETNARIISRAETPEAPSFPQKGPMLVLAAMIAFGFGLGVASIAELTSRKIRYLNDIDWVSGAPVLAALPPVKKSRDAALLKPSGKFAEGIRALYAGLGLWPVGDQRGRAVVVTSTARGEGRTTTAVGLARSMAESGLRVLLIDADFQHPDLAKVLGLSQPMGFKDLIAGRAGYSDVIVRQPNSSLHVMAAGEAEGASLLSSRQLQPIMLGLVYAYDVVVLDCAPVNSGDAQALLWIADQCVYAVRWNATKRDRVLAGVRQLSASRGRGGISLVLTGANVSATYTS